MPAEPGPTHTAPPGNDTATPVGQRAVAPGIEGPPTAGALPAQQLLERLSTGAALLDQHGTIRWCNAAFAGLHAQPAHDLLGQAVTSLFEQDDNPFDHPDAMRLERDPEARYRFERSRGSLVLNHVLGPVPVGPAVVPGGGSGAVGPPQWYLLEVAPAAEPPIVRPGPFAEAAVGGDGRIVAANEGFARLAGERAGRLTGRPLIDLVAARDVDTVQQALRDAGASTSVDEHAATLEVHLARNDARPSWAEFAVFAGPRKTVLVRARDVTDRKRDELLLTEVFDGSPLPFALIGADAVIHSVNPAWRTQFGQQDTVGRNLVELLGPDGRAQLEEALHDAVGGRAASFELVVLVENSVSGPFLTRLRATALHDLSHRLDRLLVSLDDLTEHALEVELARRNASHVRATLDEVDLAVVVHEPNGIVREINLGAHRLFGAAATDLVGHGSLPSWWQPRHPDGSALAPDDHPAQRVLGDGDAQAESVIGLRIGTVEQTEAERWYLVKARAITDASLRRRIGAVVTYSEISSLQRELISTRSERLAALDAFDSLPVAVYQTARDFTPVRVSAALRDLARGCVRLGRGSARSSTATAGPDERASTPAAASAAPPTSSSPADGGPTTEPGSPDRTDHPDADSTVIDLTDGARLNATPDVIELRQPAPSDPPPSGHRAAPAADGPSAARLRRLRRDTEDEPFVGDLFSLVHRDDRRAAADAFAEATSRHEAVRFHHRLSDEQPDHARWVDHQITPLVVDGEVEGYLGVLIPVPDWVAQGDRTRRLVRLVETTNDLVGEYDVETSRITYLNPRAIEVFEANERRLERLRLSNLYGADAEALFRSVIWPALREHSQWEGELPMITAAGNTIHVQQWITAERDADNRITRIVAAGHDVTDRSQREAELALRATHDALTGLPNRTLLLEKLDAALGRARRTNRLVGLAFLDLDRFKLINDRYGHDGGDTLLVQVATRVASVLRPADLVARLGGDEFVVLCDGVEDKTHALAIANRVAVAIGARPYSVNGATVRVSASLGLALSAGSDHPEALLRDADAALYRAKDSGRARIELFDETMRSRANSRVLLAEELRASLEAGAIAVHYQPSIDLRSGTVRAVEALARWEHPTRGLLQPSDFIEVAESTGLLAELGYQVLQEAAGRARAWEKRFGGAAPAIHVNLSTRQIVDSEMLDTVEAVLASTGLRPSMLCLELTESVLLEDSEQAIGTVRDLKALGVQLAIDDFGTGYSSLSYLSRLPVDVVKIDRSFVEDLDPSRPNASVISAAVISLAHALGLSTIAEGVTTVTQLAELHRLGCDAAQGFYFSPPLTGDAIDSYLANRLRRARGLEPVGP